VADLLVWLCLAESCGRKLLGRCGLDIGGCSVGWCYYCDERGLGIVEAKLVHKLEFTAKSYPLLSELDALIKTAIDHGFDMSTPVVISAGTDERDHDYVFKAVIGAEVGS
jgi:hypothetical protein